MPFVMSTFPSKVYTTLLMLTCQEKTRFDCTMRHEKENKAAPYLERPIEIEQEEAILDNTGALLYKLIMEGT